MPEINFQMSTFARVLMVRDVGNLFKDCKGIMFIFMIEGKKEILEARHFSFENDVIEATFNRSELKLHTGLRIHAYPYPYPAIKETEKFSYEGKCGFYAFWGAEDESYSIKITNDLGEVK